jgi:hypothetical protein
LPSAASTRLEYVPAPAGLAELRGVISERSAVPRTPLTLAALGLSAAVSRELRVTTGSIAGGGERMDIAWRFWPRRPRIAASIAAPAPWGGVWAAQAYSERQPFDVSGVAATDQTGGRLRASNWMAARWRWSADIGLDEWSDIGVRSALGAALQFVSIDSRLDGRVETNVWAGRSRYTTMHSTIRARSSIDREGLVYLASAGIEAASAEAPMNLWAAGDTGHVRPTLLRAHPVLNAGRLRVERLGRAFLHGSVEAQRWWRTSGLIRTAAAAFGDVGQTAWRASGESRGDVDIGVGARVVVAGIPGVFRADVGKGLRDGATAISLVYEP